MAGRPAARRPRGRRGRAKSPSGLHALAIAVGLGILAIVLLSLPSQESTALPRVPLHAAPGAPAVGADASWPNCRRSITAHALPHPAFAIVGVNDGVPGTVSGCLRKTMAWAATATGGPGAVAYYVMAADPWQPAERRWATPRWPSSDVVAGRRIAIPAAYGHGCRGSHTSRACAYVFGWSTARFDAAIPGVVDAAHRRWWLDVETPRDFNRDPVFNQALIEGMAAYFTAPPAKGGLGSSTGIYSNLYYWSVIVGDLRKGSPLGALDEWYPIGPGTPAEAVRAAKDLAPFTPGGRITIVQAVSGGLDVDVRVP
ncbi:MAG: hypothetical protein ACTHJL_14380 [Amnibacterium sp.]